MLSEEITYTDPTITTSGTLTAFSSNPGVASAEQSYTVTGYNLTEGITVTAPADFEVSLTSGSGFGFVSIPGHNRRHGVCALPTILIRYLQRQYHPHQQRRNPGG